MRDGLPKLKDFPAEFGGSGEVDRRIAKRSFAITARRGEQDFAASTSMQLQPPDSCRSGQVAARLRRIEPSHFGSDQIRWDELEIDG